MMDPQNYNHVMGGYGPADELREDAERWRALCRLLDRGRNPIPHANASSVELTAAVDSGLRRQNGES